MSQEENSTCRVCLQTDSKRRMKYLSIFDKHSDYLISELINSIADVKIREGDGLPSKICPDCLLELETVVAFKTKCENSNILLRTTLLNNQNLTEPESSREKLLEEIKKEEPEKIRTNIKSEYLNTEYFFEGTKTETDTCNNLESEETGGKNVDTHIEKSRAIDLKLELQESLICQLCKLTFKSDKAFKLHAQRKSKACLTASKVCIKGIGKSRVFHCNECNYSSIRIKDIRTHLVIHTGERPYVCKICMKGFGQQTSLQGHMETAHKIFHAETTCVICGKHLKGRDRIYKHMKTHSSKRVQCDICKNFLKSKASLIEHLQRHTGVKPYACDQCAKRFYAISELCNHRRTVHEKGKHIYKCEICGYKAYTKVIIKKHRARHTETNLACVECGMFLEDAKKFAEHQKRHTGEKKYPCPHCEKRYMDRKARSLHVRKVHKCTFKKNKPIKQETSSSSVSSNSVKNMIEVEVPSKLL